MGLNINTDKTDVLRVLQLLKGVVGEMIKKYPKYFP